VTATSDDLKVRFTGAVLQKQHWAFIWQLLASHSWFRDQLEYWAKDVVRTRGAPLQWWEDVRQEAELLLGKRLAKRPDLGIDLERAEHSFAPWMQTIMIHDCQQGLRTVRARYQGHAAAGQVEDTVSPDEALDRRIDVAWAIDQLDEPERTAVILRGQQLTLEQLAKAMDVTYWESRTVLERGLKRLRFLLGNSYGEDTAHD